MLLPPRRLPTLALPAVCLLLSSAPTAAQNARLSAMTSWRATNLLHLGVAVDTQLGFDVCALLVSTKPPASKLVLQGVDLVVDPTSMFVLPMVAQHLANPSQPKSTHYRWRLDTRVPEAVGATLRFQAITISSKTLRFDLSSGVVGRIERDDPKLHERHYGMRFTIGGTPPKLSLTFAEFDVDAVQHRRLATASTAIGTSLTQAALMGKPRISPDGNLAAISIVLWNPNTSTSTQTRVYVLDRRTGTGAWLPAPARGLFQGIARFRPGDSTHLWILERWPGHYRNGIADLDADLGTYNARVGTAGFGTRVSGNVMNRDGSNSTSPKHLLDGWCFSDTGSWVYFPIKESFKNGYGAVWQDSYAVTAAHALVSHNRVLIEPSGRLSWHRPSLAVPGSNAVLSGYYRYEPARHSIHGFDASRRLVVGPTPEMTGNAFVAALAADGSFGLLASADLTGSVYVLDLTRGFPASAAFRTDLIGTNPGWGTSNSFAPVGGRVLIHQPGQNRPIERFEWRGGGKLDVESIAGVYPPSDWRKNSDDAIAMDRVSSTLREEAGHATMRDRAAVVVRARGYYTWWLGVIDADTLTLGPRVNITMSGVNTVF